MIKKEKCCPPSIAYANSADAPYIPSPKGRGFTALSIMITSFYGRRSDGFLFARGRGCGMIEKIAGIGEEMIAWTNTSWLC